MLNNLELNKLLNIFSNPQLTFDHIWEEFKKKYGYDRFKACYGLNLFLIENMLTQIQRLCAIYVTILSFQEELKKHQHPFGGVILDLIGNPKNSNNERMFAYELYINEGNPVKKFGHQKIQEFL